MRENGKWTDDEHDPSMSEIDRPSIYSKFFTPFLGVSLIHRLSLDEVDVK